MVCGEEEDGEIDHFRGLGNDDGLSSESLEPVALTSVVLLDTDGERFAHNQLIFRQNLSIRRQLISAEKIHVPMLNPCVKSLQRARASITTFPLKQLSCNRIQHLPEPELLRFFCK